MKEMTLKELKEDANAAWDSAENIAHTADDKIDAALKAAMNDGQTVDFVKSLKVVAKAAVGVEVEAALDVAWEKTEKLREARDQS